MKTTNCFLVLFLMGLLFEPAILLQAQENQTTYTLQNCIDIALEHSSVLMAGQMEIQKSEAIAMSAFYKYFPSVVATASYARLSERDPAVIELPAPMSKKVELSPSIENSTAYILKVTQPLFTGFKILNANRQTDELLASSQQEYEAKIKDLVHETQKAYWSLVKAREAENVIVENIKLVETHLRDIKSMYRQGLATTNDILKVEMQLSSIDLLKNETNNAIQLAQSRLNLLMDKPLDSSLNLQAAIYHNSNVDVKNRLLDELYDQALQNRAEIKALQLKHNASEYGTKIAKSGFYPQIALFGNYQNSRPNPNIFPLKDEFTTTWEAGIQISFDFLNVLDTPQKVKESRALAEQLAAAIKQLEDAIKFQVMQSSLNLEQSIKQMDTALKMKKQAEENLKISQEMFKSGLALNSNVLEAELILLQANLKVSDSRIDHEMALVDLQWAMGSR